MLYISLKSGFMTEYNL